MSWLPWLLAQVILHKYVSIWQAMFIGHFIFCVIVAWVWHMFKSWHHLLLILLWLPRPSLQEFSLATNQSKVFRNSDQSQDRELKRLTSLVTTTRWVERGSGYTCFNVYTFIGNIFNYFQSAICIFIRRIIVNKAHFMINKYIKIWIHF